MEFDVVLELPAFTSTEPLAEAVFGCLDAVGQGVVEVGELAGRFNVELLFPSLKGHGGGQVEVSRLSYALNKLRLNMSAWVVR